MRHAKVDVEMLWTVYDSFTVNVKGAGHRTLVMIYGGKGQAIKNPKKPHWQNRELSKMKMSGIVLKVEVLKQPVSG